MRQKFRAYDRDGSGFMDKAELKNFLSDLKGASATKSEILFALNEIDTSHDQKISLDEFMQWLV